MMGDCEICPRIEAYRLTMKSGYRGRCCFTWGLLHGPAFIRQGLTLVDWPIQPGPQMQPNTCFLKIYMYICRFRHRSKTPDHGANDRDDGLGGRVPTHEPLSQSATTMDEPRLDF
jgi:hypothetical protein